MRSADLLVITVGSKEGLREREEARKQLLIDSEKYETVGLRTYICAEGMTSCLQSKSIPTRGQQDTTKTKYLVLSNNRGVSVQTKLVTVGRSSTKRPDTRRWFKTDLFSTGLKTRHCPKNLVSFTDRKKIGRASCRERVF